MPEMFYQQRAHLPAMAHLFDHHAGERLAVVFARCGLEEPALLLDGCKLGVALVHDQVDESIADLLRRYLAQVLPLLASLPVAELDVVSLDGAEERIEVEAADLVVVHADLFAPVVEQSDPFAEVPDLECRNSHESVAPNVAYFFRCSECEPNALQLGVMLNGVRAQLASEARLLVPAKRH